MTNTIKLPGLIDTHVHLREPGATQKEDFETGTKAAIAGGYTLVLDMPNNPQPVTSAQVLEEKIKLADKKIYSDLGFHFGATRQSISYFEQVRGKVFGLKVYMNHTTGPLLVEDLADLNAIFEAWPKDKTLMVHAEDQTLKTALDLAFKYKNQLLICHVSLRSQLELIKFAKDNGQKVSCEVSMHHLYLTEKDRERLGSFGVMRPPLATEEDRMFLWENIKDIDIIASDHAPHTKEEKAQTPAPNGVPGLESSLPLLLNAVNHEQITVNDIIRLTYDNPRKIFDIPEQKNTYVEVDLNEEWTISNEGLYTKCGWTPFKGLRVKGKVIKTVIRGDVVFENGKIVSGPSGKIVYPI